MAMATKPLTPIPRRFWFASLLGCTPGFKKSRCKKLLKVTMSRIKLLRRRREVQVRQLRRDVAQLLLLGQEQNAQSRLDRLWKEHSLLSAYIKIGEYCQLVKANLSNIGRQRECPLDLRESLASLCFSASCCADLPELQEIREIMVMKYGKEFLFTAQDLRPSCHVNELILEAFSSKRSSEASKQALLKDVCTEYNVVQGVETQVPPPQGGLRDAPSGLSGKSIAPGFTDRNPSRQGYGSSSGSSKKPLKSSTHEQDVLQEQKHHKSSKQTRSIATMPTNAGALGPTGEHISDGLVDGLGQKRMPRKHRGKREHLHQEVDVMQEITGQGGTKETDLGSREMLSGPQELSHGKSHKRRSKSRPKDVKLQEIPGQGGTIETNLGSGEILSGPQELSHGKSHKGRSKSRPKDVKKAHRRDARINNDDQEDQHIFSNGRPVYEKFRPETAAVEVANGQPFMHGYGNGSLPEDCNTHIMQKERRYTLREHHHEEAENEGHRDPSRKSRPERGANVVVNGQPSMHGYGNESSEGDFNTHVMHRERKPSDKQHCHAETNKEVYCKSNGKSRPERTKNEVVNGGQSWHGHGDKSLPEVFSAHKMQREGKQPQNLKQPYDAEAKIGGSLQSQFSKPPQRPPPPVPPYRVTSLPKYPTVTSPPDLPQRSSTLEPSHFRQNQEPHVHPKLPEYEDLVASFAALRKKPPMK